MSATYLNHWSEYKDFHLHPCEKAVEFCHNCGRQLVESIEPTGMRSRKNGEPLYARWHSCPTWTSGWRTTWWARWWATPGWGHDSHDADEPMSARGYA